MGFSHHAKVNILPDHKVTAQQISHGPYAYLCHPMYSAILLFFTPLAWHPKAGLVTWLNLIALWLVLIIKLTYEEKLLAKTYSTYQAYYQDKARLIPFIY